MQLGITAVTLLQGSYVLFLVSLPLAIYNIKLYLSSGMNKGDRLLGKKHRVYALFRKDYKGLQENKRALLIKSIFNAVFCLITLLKLSVCDDMR